MKLINHSKNIENHIQTFRAFSVLSVFLYHTNLDLFSYGYLGVDIFFLISGYVISKRIFEDKDLFNRVNKKKIYNLPLPLYNYVKHNNSLTSKK